MTKTPVPVASLKIGMFVVELDRPWSETPFLTEGFLVTESDQMEMLRNYCRRVFIDPLRSSPESLSHLGDLRASQRDAGWDGERVYEVALGKLFPEWKKKVVSSKLAGKMARATHFIDQRVLALLGQGKMRRIGSARLRQVSSRISMFTYRNTRGAKSEMRRARPLYLHAEKLLVEASSALKEKLPLDLKGLDQAAREMVKSVIANPQPLLWLSWIRALGLQPNDHAMRVAIQLLAFGRHVGLPEEELRKLCMTGLLLDLGKAKVDRGLLQKREALTADELSQVRRHIDFTLEAIGGPGSELGEDVYRGIAETHERLDGTGYPKHLLEKEIGLHGRMAGIVDTFATLTIRRAYSPAMSAFDALKVLYAGTETSFSRELVEQFILALGIYPVGSLVELSSGEIAVVLYQTPQHQLRPRILVLTDAEKLPKRSQLLDLLANPKDRNDHLVRITRGLPLGAYGLDPRRFQLG